MQWPASHVLVNLQIVHRLSSHHDGCMDGSELQQHACRSKPPSATRCLHSLQASCAEGGYVLRLSKGAMQGGPGKIAVSTRPQQNCQRCSAVVQPVVKADRERCMLHMDLRGSCGLSAADCVLVTHIDLRDSCHCPHCFRGAARLAPLSM